MDDRGSVFIEYVLVLALVAVGATAAIALVGKGLVALFIFQEAWLLLPFP